MTTTAIPQGLATGTWTIDPSHSEASFTVRHAGISKVRGTVSIVSGELVLGETLADSTLTATLDPASVSTGDANRDGHLKSGDFFDVENNPEMTFDGQCLAIDPPRLLEIRWGVDVLRLELAEDADGTSLTFTSRLGDKGHAALTGSGWHHCLDVLQSHVDGTLRPQLDDAGWDALRADYRALVGD